MEHKLEINCCKIMGKNICRLVNLFHCALLSITCVCVFGLKLKISMIKRIVNGKHD